MNAYLLIESQGEGCDYTIGCGIRTTYFEATDDAAALRAAEERIGVNNWHAGRKRDCAIKDATLYRVAVELDIEGHMNGAEYAWRQAESDRQQAATTAKERAEFERLQAKFGKEQKRG